MYDTKLETFVQIVHDGSFAKAAEHLYISSVSVMKQINSLEESINVKLFDRTPQGVTLTKAGTYFYQATTKYMAKAEQIIQHSREIGNQEKRTIRIGTSLLRSAQPLMELWSGLSNQHAYQIELVSFEDDPLSMQRMFMNLGNKIDLFVGPVNSEQIETGPYRIYNLPDVRAYWGVPINNPLANKEKLTDSDLVTEKVLLVKRGMSSKLDQLRDHLEQSQIQVVDTESFYDINTFNICSQNNYIMETLSIWQQAYSPIKSVAMDFPFSMPYGMVYSENASKTVTDFIELIGSEYVKSKR